MLSNDKEFGKNDKKNEKWEEKKLRIFLTVEAILDWVLVLCTFNSLSTWYLILCMQL